MLLPNAPALRATLIVNPPPPLNWARAVIALAPARAVPTLQDGLRHELTMARYQGRKVLGGGYLSHMASESLERGGRAWLTFDDAQVAKETRKDLRRQGVAFDETSPVKETTP